MADYARWAQRRAGRGERAPQAEPQQPIFQRASSPPPATLPMPPPGYAWATHPQHGFIMVAISSVPAQPAAPTTFTPPPRQPSGVVPFVPQPLTSQMPPGHATPRVETCVLVKPGNKDTYSDLLAQLPSLAPDNGGYDAMAGNPSPETVQAVGGCSEFAMSQNGQELRSFPVGAHIVGDTMPLKG